METIVERLGGEAETRLRYFCSPHHQDRALHPAMTQIERAAGFRRDDTAKQRLDKLERMLAGVASDPREVVPPVAAMLSIPTGERYPPLQLTPRKQKERTLEALLGR